MIATTEDLAPRTRPGDLFERLEGNRIRCLACGHRCPIPAGFSGVCRVRFNRQGTLQVPFGYVNAVHCDPIEKKPFFHAFPGTATLSFGMLGCSFHCAYCQNWLGSQALRDFRSVPSFREASPGSIVAAAVFAKASAVVSTYNEPLITAEWAAAVFGAAKAAGLATGMVSNGSATTEVIEYLRPSLDLCKVDLKSMDDRRYHELGGRLAPVLESIRAIHAAGIWLEVVTLVVPGFNDSDAELSAAARFLAGISRDIPWHLTPFHPDYKMTDRESTPSATLERAAAIARDAGLRFVYTRRSENTLCPECGDVLIERCGQQVLHVRTSCCGQTLPGRWSLATLHHPPAPLIHSRCG